MFNVTFQDRIVVIQPNKEKIIQAKPEEIEKAWLKIHTQVRALHEQLKAVKADPIMAVVFQPIQLCELCHSISFGKAIPVAPINLASRICFPISQCPECPNYLESLNGQELLDLINQYRNF